MDSRIARVKKLIYLEQKERGKGWWSVVQSCMYSFVFETPWKWLLGTKTCRSFETYVQFVIILCAIVGEFDWLYILIGVEFRFICCFSFYLSSACVRPVTKRHASPQPVVVSNGVWSERKMSRWTAVGAWDYQCLWLYHCSIHFILSDRWT
jgi:hypothetical protein